MDTKKITVAIDGHSSCGKSTMARHLAQQLGYIYIDSGAMYRAVTLYALRHGLMDAATRTIDTDRLAAAIDGVDIGFVLGPDGRPQTCLDGAVVEAEIRGMEVSQCVSPIAVLPFVRARLVALQQQMGHAGGIVMDGRDIGTTVFPHAELKVFVTASPEVRAQRRLRELQQKGDTQATLDDVLRNVRERDYIDSHREVSPLRPADDARLLDNSDLTIEAQNALLLAWAQEAIDAAQ